MAALHKQVTISAPANLIWDVIMDLRRAKEWAPGFEDYPFISADWPSSGATAIWRYHAGPMHFDFNLKLITSNRGRGVEIENRSVFGKGMEIYRFQNAAGKTTIEYQVNHQPTLLGRLFDVMMRSRVQKQMDQTIENLKQYCEARAL